MLLFIISSIALLVISATMLARANDLRWRKGLVWNARLTGFILAGFGPWGVIGFEFLEQDWPNIYEVIFRFGLMLVFLTTPYLPPWWKWISGKDQSTPQWADDRRLKEKEL